MRIFKPHSIRQEFTLGLVTVVTMIMLVFSFVLIFHNNASLEKNLHHRLNQVSDRSRENLSSALWEYNHDYVDDYLDSLFFYDDMTYVSINYGNAITKTRVRPGLPEKTFSDFNESAGFLVKHTDVRYKEVKVGTIFLVMSRERINRLMITNSAIAIALLFLIIAAIVLTNLYLSRKVLFHPLSRLEHAVEQITAGNLDVKIDTSGKNEIGHLASTFDLMMKRLKATTASRNELEDEIKERTRIQEELKWELELSRLIANVLKALMAKQYDINHLERIILDAAQKITRSRYGCVSASKNRRLTFPEALGEKCGILWAEGLDPEKPFHTNNPLEHPEYRGVPEGHLPVRNVLAVPVFLQDQLAGQIALANSESDYTEKELRALERIAEIYGTGLLRHLYETEKTGLEKRLHRAQRMESIGNLAGGIAHDFNNILSSILGFTELALDDAGKESQTKHHLREVYAAGKRAKELVKQILAFARRSDEEIKPIQVDAIAKEVLKLIRPTIPTTIKIEEQIETCGLIMGNATQVHQIFMNLCTNAAQAMKKEGGILEVALTDVTLHKHSLPPDTTLKPGNHLKITISDSGTGIPQEILHSIFEPYFTTKGSGEGTGMGLAMVHGIVESYGGSISVTSKPAKGTRFVIYLPVTEKPADPRPHETTPLPSGSERILLVDDEAVITRVGSQMLEHLGYSVTAKTDSREALELFRSKPGDFDLVITDMTMPNMTGDRLAEELMTIRPDLPVILFTGYSSTIAADTAFQMGIKAFAYKPIVMADLAKIVRKVLDEAS